MNIAGRAIAPHEPPYIIAEIGVNHDGDLRCAIDLVRTAADAGANAVKFQLFRADLLMSRAAQPAAYQMAAGEHDPIAMLRRLELPTDALARCIDEAHERHLHTIITPFSLDLLPEARHLPVDAWKTASPDIIHKPLLHALARTGVPLIVSTGASTLDEIDTAIAWLAPAIGRLAILQCVSAYPAPDEAASLGAIHALTQRTGVPVGYSDHTTSIDTGALAVAAGACILEKHLTHNRAAHGPDHAASLDPAQFAGYVRLAHRAFAMRGPTTKDLLPIEADVRAVSRQSITSRAPIPAGRTITPDLITIKRPGTGLPPALMHETIGRIAARDILADAPITHSDLA